MPEQIFIGNFPKGLITNRLPFVIDNDAFPYLYNFYIWRGRAKRKRGTVALARLEVQVQMVANATPPAVYQSGQLTLSSGALNLFSATISGITQATQAVVTIAGSIYYPGYEVLISGVVGMTQINGGPYTVISVTPTSLTLNVDSTGFTAYSSGGTVILDEFQSIVPDSLSLVVGANTYTDNGDGTLNGTPAGTGTINYATGDVTISGGGSSALTGSFSFYPAEPAMGVRDFVSNTSSSIYPLTIAFDDLYAYQINQTGMPFWYNVTYYKGTNTPFVWSGQDFQLFYTTNYSKAFWATNNKPGFHFVTATYTSGSGSPNIVMNLKSGGVNYPNLIIGDKLWFNEWAAGGVTINGLVGTVSVNSGAASGNYTITFTGNQTVSSTGIAQLLTASILGQDGIRWYDGDPTGGTGIPTGSGLGWVNFAPPLTAAVVSINNLPAALYYLVGALVIIPFKDRLVFFNPYIQTSTGQALQLQDTAIWSWNGTPYYTTPVPTPASGSETADIRAYYVDQTGLGGYLSAGISQPITTVSNNEDVLLVGFGGSRGRKTRFVYTGNDFQPFLFYNINSELPSDSTFSSVALDKGAIDLGIYGIALTDQQSSSRIDLDIPDAIFTIQALNNGILRVNAVRDFYKEWIYFAYPVDDSQWKFPTQTFLFNYRDNTWAVFYENFTCHGNFRKTSSYTWATLPFKTWAQWREPWNAGSSTALFPSVAAGNPQGFILLKGQGTGEAPSGQIVAIASNSFGTQITSYNHCVAVGDFLYFQGAISTLQATITNISQATQAVVTATNTFVVGEYVLFTQVVGMTQINGKFAQITAATGANFTINLNTVEYTAYISGGLATFSPLQNQIGKVNWIIDVNNFTIDITYITSTYFGLGVYSKLSQPFMQTKQFNPYWDQGRQVRLSAQKYLFDFTANGQLTVNIYLSQDPDDSWNSFADNPPPNGLVYSQLLYTCPESTNIGLTPPNTNLQMPTAANQYQIWHRFNSSMIGDTFQIGFTLSTQETSPGSKDAQMYNLEYATSEITLHGMHITIDKSSHLA